MKKIVNIAIILVLFAPMMLNAQSIERISFSPVAGTYDLLQPVAGVPYSTSMEKEHGASLTISAEYGPKNFNSDAVEEQHIMASEDGMVFVYPNPTTDIVNVHINNVEKFGDNLQIMLYDISGRLLQVNDVDGQSETSINVSNLPAGSYVMKVDNYSATIIKR